MSESGDFFVLFCATHVASNHANVLEQKLRTFYQRKEVLHKQGRRFISWEN